MAHTKPDSLALETYVLRNYNYLNHMVDADGQPYFNIFWTEPAEAAHDWPDFGDVMSRQLQATIMARHMTGVPVEIENRWHEKLHAYLDPATGLLLRPATNYSNHVADMGDQALTLYTLVTAYLDQPDTILRDTICRMVDSLIALSRNQPSSGEGFLSGFIIKSLMACVRALDYAPALDLAAQLVRKVFVEQPLFMPDNSFRQGGHMHGNLRTLVGIADYALYTHDAILYSRVDALYRYVRSEATRFGFLPESIGRKGDIVLCETCALMDYIGLAVTLANNGHPEYWGDVERVVRNQLIESQVVDGSWLSSDPPLPDTPQFTRHDVGARMVGGYAGWSSPTQILAVCETLGMHWGGPELRNKTRAFQNCCGGSGTHAFFIAWKNAARFHDGQLDVNLHLDKLLPEAEIRCYQPYQGLLTIYLKTECSVRVRIPEFVTAEQIWIEANGIEVQVKSWGNYIELGTHPAGTLLKVAYPLPIQTDDTSIGNPGYRKYHYQVTWKGDTVVKMTPIGNEYPTGYSDFDKKEVPIFYGETGPSRLYQRDAYLQDAMPRPSALHLDDGTLDFWYLQ
jgi:hypothetical protein